MEKRIIEAKFAVVNFSITAVETEGGLGNGWNQDEQRFNVVIPIDAVNSIDFNKIRKDFIEKSVESFNKRNAKVS